MSEASKPTSVHHRCKVRDPNGRNEKFFAYCKPRRGRCDWVGPTRASLVAAWGDAVTHDPQFPQGDNAQERASV